MKGQSIQEDVDMVIEAANAVGQTVTDQVSLTEKFLNKLNYK